MMCLAYVLKSGASTRGLSNILIVNLLRVTYVPAVLHGETSFKTQLKLNCKKKVAIARIWSIIWSTDF